MRNQLKKEFTGYVTREVLRENQYTKAADIYSFGVVMNEFISEEAHNSDIPVIFPMMTF